MYEENINLKKLRVGQKAISPGRTITETDIVLFAGLSGDWTELHTNAEYMRNSLFGQRIAHGMLTLSIASGLALRARGLPPFEILAFLGMEAVKLSAPVFIGDTIWVEVETLEVRPSKSRPDSLILKLKNTVKNQREEVVATWNSVLMVKQ